MTGRRRERGSLIDPTKAPLIFERAANDRLAAMAIAAGSNKSAVAQWLIERCELDEQGRPVGWTDDHPKHEMELPLADSA